MFILLILLIAAVIIFEKMNLASYNDSQKNKITIGFIIGMCLLFLSFVIVTISFIIGYMRVKQVILIKIIDFIDVRVSISSSSSDNKID